MRRIFDLSKKTKIFICIGFILVGLFLLGTSINRNSSEYIGTIDATVMNVTTNPDFDKLCFTVALDCNGTLIYKTFSMKTAEYRKPLAQGDTMTVDVYLAHKDGKTYKVIR